MRNFYILKGVLVPEKYSQILPRILLRNKRSFAWPDMVLNCTSRVCGELPWRQGENTSARARVHAIASKPVTAYTYVRAIIESLQLWLRQERRIVDSETRSSSLSLQYSTSSFEDGSLSEPDEEHEEANRMFERVGNGNGIGNGNGNGSVSGNGNGKLGKVIRYNCSRLGLTLMVTTL